MACPDVSQLLPSDFKEVRQEALFPGVKLDHADALDDLLEELDPLVGKLAGFLNQSEYMQKPHDIFTLLDLVSHAAILAWTGVNAAKTRSPAKTLGPARVKSIVRIAQIWKGADQT